MKRSWSSVDESKQTDDDQIGLSEREPKNKRQKAVTVVDSQESSESQESSDSQESESQSPNPTSVNVEAVQPTIIITTNTAYNLIVLMSDEKQGYIPIVLGCDTFDILGRIADLLQSAVKEDEKHYYPDNCCRLSQELVKAEGSIYAHKLFDRLKKNSSQFYSEVFWKMDEGKDVNGNKITINIKCLKGKVAKIAIAMQTLITGNIVDVVVIHGWCE